MMIGMLFWAALAIAAIVVIARALGARPLPPPQAPNETPLDVLKRRLAAGDLDVEEYEKRKKILLEQPST